MKPFGFFRNHAGIIIGLSLALCPTSSPALVTLQNATATINQDLGNHHIANAIDGDTLNNTLCWGTYPGMGSTQSAVFQTTAANNDAGWFFDLYFSHFAGGHKIQQFKLYATTDSAPTTASGATWTQLTPTFADGTWDTGPVTNAILGDNSVRYSGIIETGNFSLGNARWTVEASNPGLVNVTGFRLEAIPYDDDGNSFSSLGFQKVNSGLANNGNIALTEFTVTTAPEPSRAMLTLAGLILAGLRRRR